MLTTYHCLDRWSFLSDLAVLKKEREQMIIRFAKENELIRVNEMRKQVNDLHVEGKPEVFRAGFNKELQDHIYTIWNDPEQEIIVAETEGIICGFAVLHHIYKPQNPFMNERDFLDIDEFCVDKVYRRQGIASEMISFIRNYAKEKEWNRVELNMREFNEEALAFYEAMGFKTYRRYMEMML